MTSMPATTGRGTAHVREEAAGRASAALAEALYDLGVDAGMRAPNSRGWAVAAILRVPSCAGGDCGLRCDRPATAADHVAALGTALARDSVPCTAEIRDMQAGLLILHLTTPEDADALTRWIVSRLTPERAAARRLRHALASIGVDLHPQLRGAQIEIGPATPADVASLYRALGGTGDVADGMAAMAPQELRDLADLLAARFRTQAQLALPVEAEPVCRRCATSCYARRIRLGPVTGPQALALAAHLEPRTGTKEVPR
jgi:hypothetical protein